MPIWTLVSGVRSSCDAAAMNSDLSRLISLRWVMSSSSVTVPSSRWSVSCIGVERMRNARRDPSTAHGQHGCRALRRHRPARSQDVVHRLRDARVARDVLDPFADGVDSPAKQPFSGGVDAGDLPFAIGDDHRVVEGIDGRFGRLLGDEQFAQIGSPQLADSLGHLVEADGERPDLVGRLHGNGRIQIARRHPRRRGGQLADGTDDGAREAELDRHAHDHEQEGQPQRDEEPSAGDGRREIGFAAHGLLVEVQEPIAVRPNRVERGSRTPKYRAVRSPDAWRNWSNRR